MGTGAFAGLLDIATESFNTPMELEQVSIKEAVKVAHCGEL